MDKEKSWKHDKDSFNKHLNKVKLNWTTEQLLEHAGNPDSKEDNEWDYNFQEKGFGCVRYEWFTFKIKDGKVVDVDSDEEEKTIRPNRPIE